MRPTDASYPVREEEIVPTSTLGPVLHPLTDWIYGREIGSPFQGKEAPGSSAGARLSSSGYLRAFLSYYLNQIAYPIELPTIVQAYYLSQRQQTRELIELDQTLSLLSELQPFAAPSRRIGLAQLRSYRPLRDQRLALRYLSAVEARHAFGWHSLVYSITLSIYSFPIRQGLSHYLRKTLFGFIEAACGSMDLSPCETKIIRSDFHEEIRLNGADHIRACIQDYYLKNASQKSEI